MDAIYDLASLVLLIVIFALAAFAGLSVKGGLANWIVGVATFLFLAAVSIPAFLWFYNESCNYATNKCV